MLSRMNSAAAELLRHLRASRLGARVKALAKRQPLLRPIFKLVSQRAVDYAFPITFNVEPTNACNLKCTICPRETSGRALGYMDMDLFRRIVDEAARFGPRNFALHKDGEPLLHPRLAEMVRTIKQRHPKNTVYLTTNGTRLTEDLGRELIDAGLDILHFSIGAATREGYAHVKGRDLLDTVEQNVLRFLVLKQSQGASRPVVYVQIVKTKETEAEIPAFVAKWKGRGVEISAPGFLTWGGALSDDYLREQKPLKRYPCHSLWTSPAINWDGSVSLCCIDFRAEEILGNVKETPLAAIWQGEKIRTCRRLHLEGEWNRIPICKGCNYWREVPDLFFAWQKKR